MSPADRAYVETLKAEQTGVQVVIEGSTFRVRFLGRGEVAFVQHGDRGLLCEVIAGRGVIFAKSIRRWDDTTKIQPTEREQIIRALVQAMTDLEFDEVRVVRE